MLIPSWRRDFNTGCNSSSSTAKSPSTTALSSVPANAAQVFTPISLPTSVSIIFAVRPITTLNIPLFTCPFMPRMSSTVLPVMELWTGCGVPPNIIVGCGFAARLRDFEDTLGGAPRAFESGQLFDAGGVEFFCLRRSAEQGDEANQKGIESHERFHGVDGKAMFRCFKLKYLLHLPGPH